MKLKNLFEELIKELESKHGYASLIPRIEKVLKIKVKSTIASGTKSDVFDIGSKKVLKITKGESDVEGFVTALQNPHLPIPKVYAIYELVGTGIEEKLWAIISQKADTDGITTDDANELEDWFNNNSSHYPNDMITANVGRIDGKLVYTDPSFIYGTDITSVEKLTI